QTGAARVFIAPFSLSPWSATEKLDPLLFSEEMTVFLKIGIRDSFDVSIHKDHVGVAFVRESQTVGVRGIGRKVARRPIRKQRRLSHPSRQQERLQAVH